MRSSIEEGLNDLSEKKIETISELFSPLVFVTKSGFEIEVRYENKNQS